MEDSRMRRGMALPFTREAGRAIVRSSRAADVDLAFVRLTRALWKFLSPMRPD
ncbi:hypothetical protein CERSUDRAFT_83695, partial [Gelatoporia subvermispora B]